MAVFERLAARLAIAQQSNDWVAYEAIWTEQWSMLYTTAVRYGRSMGWDPSTVEQRASDALGAAWMEIGATLADPGAPRPGDPEFLKRLLARVIFRFKSGRRQAARLDKRFRDVAGGEDERDPLERLVVTAATQEDDLMRGQQTRETIRNLVIDLAMAREICRGSPVLVETLNRMMEYVRDCFAKAVPTGTDTAAMTLDELVERADPAEVQATKAAMYEYVMNQLALTRNVVDLRMARIRKALDKARGGASGARRRAPRGE